MTDIPSNIEKLNYDSKFKQFLVHQKEVHCLRTCYSKAFEIARQEKFGTIGVPVLGAGPVMNWDFKEAFIIALESIISFLFENKDEDKEFDIRLIVYRDDEYKKVKKIFPDISSFLDQREVANGVEEEYKNNPMGSYFMIERDTVINAERLAKEKEYSYGEQEYNELVLFNDIVNKAKPFNEYLMELMQSKGFSSEKVYTTAGMSKQTFSKIKTGVLKVPGKTNALRLCIGLELSFAESRALLERAGYAFSSALIEDFFFRRFIIERNYDIEKIFTEIDKEEGRKYSKREDME